MRVVLVLALAGAAFGQNAQLRRVSEFDLGAGLGLGRQQNKTAFSARPGGLTFAAIGEFRSAIVCADADGQVLHSRTDIEIPGLVYAAVIRPDGWVWFGAHLPGGREPSLLTKLPSASGFSNSDINHFTQLELYDADLEHRQSARLMDALVAHYPVAAATEDVYLNTVNCVGSPLPPHRGLCGGPYPPHKVTEVFNVEHRKDDNTIYFESKSSAPIYVATDAGAFIEIDIMGHRMIIVDPRAKAAVRATLPEDGYARAAAADASGIYVLMVPRKPVQKVLKIRQTELKTRDGVVGPRSDLEMIRMDYDGKVVSTWQCETRTFFTPAFLGVAGDSVYISDRFGRGERFSRP